MVDSDGRRAIAGTAVAWGVIWAGMFLALELLGAIVFTFRNGSDAAYVLYYHWTTWAAPLIIGTVGAAIGAGFAWLLSRFPPASRLRELSLYQMAAWGGTGGFLFAALAGVILASLAGPETSGSVFQFFPTVAVLTFSGAASAMATLAIARKPVPRQIAAESEGEV